MPNIENVRIDEFIGDFKNCVQAMITKAIADEYDKQKEIMLKKISDDLEEKRALIISSICLKLGSQLALDFHGQTITMEISMVNLKDAMKEAAGK